MDGPEQSLFSRLGPDAPPVGSLQAEIVLPDLGSVKIEDLGDRIRMWGDDGQSEVIAKNLIRVLGQRGALLKLDWNGDEVMMDFGSSAAALEAVDTLDVPTPPAVITQPSPSVIDPTDEVPPAAIGSHRQPVADRRIWLGQPEGAESLGSELAAGLNVVSGAPVRVDRSARTWRRRTVHVSALDFNRLERTKRAFTTRHVPVKAMVSLIDGPVRPRPGDLVLARVDRLGNHRRLELTHGRRAWMYPGDEVVVVYANRYAPDQFESYVPLDLQPTQLVASGGVASSVRTKSAEVLRATDITPLGLIGNERGTPLNLSDFRLLPAPSVENRLPTLAVIGTSMNSGKTTTIRQLVLGLRDGGHRPGVTKVTGTGSGGDYWVMLDAGAQAMLDFTDAGLASTFGVDMDVVEQAMVNLIDLLTHRGCGSILIEVADGLLQPETAQLLGSEAFRERIDGVVFAAADAMGAIAGVARLRELGLPVVAVAGRLTRSPLAMAETQAECGVPILTLAELADPVTAAALLGVASPMLEPLEDAVTVEVEETRVAIDLRQRDGVPGIGSAVAAALGEE